MQLVIYLKKGVKQEGLDSIFEDIGNAREDIVRDPVYVILNLCRVFAAVRDNLVLSKAQGGQWGLLHIAHDYHEVIQNALESYTSENEMIVDQNSLLKFADYMLRVIGVQE